MFRTKPDFVMTGRRIDTDGEDFAVPDSEYADDTAVLFTSRGSLVTATPLMISHFVRFGMDIHVGTQDKPSKSEVLFAAAPEKMYEDPQTYDGKDLSNIDLGNGTFMPVVDKFRYLGSMITRDCRDDIDVTSRIETAGNAFGALRKCIFSSPYTSFATKKLVYMALILSILLYGSETWSLTEKLFHQLRLFHHRCIRAMCRVNRKHTREYHISNTELLNRLGLSSIDAYVTRRQLRWAGHVARMDMSRMPRKMLSSWVCNKRPRGAPQFTYGRGLVKAFKKANIDSGDWWLSALDRVKWRDNINIA